MQKKIKIKAIIFDLGGVVAHGGFLPFLKHFCLECLTPLGKKKIASLERQANLGEITETEFYKQIHKVFHVELTPRQIHQYIIGKMKMDRTLIKLIPSLKPAKVALFSNSIGHMAEAVLRRDHLNKRKVFTRLFFSNKLHMAKPDRIAFEYVLKKLKVKPKQALMVDDRLENIRHAKKAGMHGLVYKNATQFKRDIKKYQAV
jgi:HAD superfamily hydrolase (TIGR01509 family)